MQPPRQRRNSHRLLVGASLLLLFVAGTSTAYAASGTIDSSQKYAWSNVGGWVNFAPTQSVVTVTDSALTGYAWSANDGWINFSPANGGVTNDGKGTLGGFAWDSAAGWVSFTGVSIDASGLFHGEATGANNYAINFDCISCAVVTTWRSTSSPPPAAPVSPAVVSSPPGSISPVFVSSPVTQSSQPLTTVQPARVPLSPTRQKYPGTASSSSGLPVQTVQGTAAGSIGDRGAYPTSTPASTHPAATSTRPTAVTNFSILYTAALSLGAVLLVSALLFVIRFFFFL